MKIYVDLVFFLNFAFDFLLLLSVSLILKRNVRLLRIVIGGLIGGFSTFLLFIPLDSISLFFLKVIISFLMVLSSFSFKNLKYTATNVLYLYLSSIIWGGFLYLLNVEFSYKNEGLVFFHNGLSINFILLIIFSPIILYIYIKQCHKLKVNYNNYHKVDLYLDDGRVLKLNGYLDTGNKLYDPYKHRPIALVFTDKINISYEDSLLVPFATLNEKGVVKCKVIPKMVIDNKVEQNNILIGLSKNKFAIDGIDLILHSDLMEGKE